MNCILSSSIKGAAVLLLLLLCFAASAQTPVWQTAVTGNQTSGDISFVNATAVDAAGNVYILGTFTGVIGFGSTSLATSNGAPDVFVAKWSTATGNFVWAKRAGGSTTYDYAKGIAVSGTSVYITGYFTGSSADFGSTTLTNSGINGSEVYVAKLADAGLTSSFVWAQRAGGASNDFAYGLAVSGNNVYVTGSFSGSTAAFGGIALSNVAVSTEDCIFVAKLVDAGPSSGFVWAQQAGAARGNHAYAIAVNGSSVYITGTVGALGSAPAQFGNLTVAAPGMYVAKLTDAGSSADFTWVLTSQAGAGTALALNGSSIYVTGGFSAATTAIGTTVLTNASSNNSDIYVAKLTDQGSTARYDWAQRAGGTSGDYAYGVAAQGNNVYVTGSYFSPSATFGAATLTNGGNNGSNSGQVYVAKLIDAGTSSNFAWALQAGGTNSDLSNAIAIEGTTLYIAGELRSSTSFGTVPVTLPASAAPGGSPLGFLATVADPLLATATAAAKPNAADMVVFPNPAHGRATVQLPPGAGPATLTILDALGRPLRTQTAATGTKAELDLTGLAPGLYAVRVAAGGNTATQQLVVE